MLRSWLIYDNIIFFILCSTLLFISTWYWYKSPVNRPLNINTRRSDVILRSTLRTSPANLPYHLPLALIIYTICWLLLLYSSYMFPKNFPLLTNYYVGSHTCSFYWIFYISTLITLTIYYARLKTGGITLNTTIAILLLFIFINLYFTATNLIATIFILECQGAALLLFLTTNAEFTKNTQSQISAAANLQSTKTWRINILLLQFWINFFGAITLILFTLLLTTHTGSNHFNTLAITSTQLFFINTPKLFSIWICIWLISSFLIKTSAFPFHFWKPELYRILSYPNIFIYAGIYTFLLFILFIYILNTTYIGWPLYIHLSFWIIALLTIYFVTPLFYRITDLKLFLAYTSVFHALYVFISIVTYKNFCHIATAYNIAYFITVITIFCTILIYKNLNLQYLSDFQVLIYNPAIMFWFISATASMAGLPPFLGFWTKFLILINLWANTEFLLMISLFSCSLIIMYFYFANYRFAGAINLISRTHYLAKINTRSLFILGNFFAFLNIYGLGIINDLFNFAIVFSHFL